MDSLMLWGLEKKKNHSRINFKPDKEKKTKNWACIYIFVLVSLHVSLSLSLSHVALRRWGIRGHINLNPRVSSASAKVPLHVWSVMFMCACSGQGWMWELGLALRWLIVGITKKKAIILSLSHIHTLSVFFSPAAPTAPISWLPLCTLLGATRQSAYSFSPTVLGDFGH